MEALLNNAPCGYITFNESGKIVLVNETLLSITGHKREDIEGRGFESLLSVAGRIFFQTHFFPLLKLHGKAEEIFLSLVSKDGNTIPVVVNSNSNSEGPNTVYACVFIPVFNRRKFEDELIEAKKKAEYDLKEDVELKRYKEEAEIRTRELDKRITQLTNLNAELLQFNEIINHDMQECIRKIILYVKLFISEKESSSLETVLQSASKLRTINKSLNTFISLGLNYDKFHHHNLGEIIEIAHSSIIEDLDFNNIVISYNGLPAIDMVADQLQLLFYQLFSNSVKYRKGDFVQIDISCVQYESNVYRNFSSKYIFEEVVKIEIKDNGIGFDVSYKDKVMAIVKKLSHTSTGIGIGLALCKKIVENHFGEISIHSEENVGTTVTLILPVKQSQRENSVVPN